MTQETRVLENVTAARKALSRAAIELAFARYRDDLPAGESERALYVELRRICELVQELERCAKPLGPVAEVPG